MSQLGFQGYALAGATLAASSALTFGARRFALTRGLLDIPNERSSHTVATPRGGGIAIVITTMTAFAVLAALRKLEFSVFAALAGGLAVAAVGYVDDRRPLPPAARLSAHAAAALWALAWLGGLPPMLVGNQLVSLGVLGTVIGVLGIVWVLNLFNFMDGIDGLAASEATFIAWSGALLTAPVTAATGVAAAALVLGAGCIGFLTWNWPPARIFMGDVGSGYLGYVIAVLAVSATRADPVELWIWLILGGAFFVDATVTLVRRVLRGESASQAHRSHAYQWLARRWGSHGRVTVAFLGLNVVWLLPCAVLAATFPSDAILWVVGALAALVPLAAAAGSGRKERYTYGQ
jgi:Fuc2NAc and GlcNAc transferase